MTAGRSDRSSPPVCRRLRRAGIIAALSALTLAGCTDDVVGDRAPADDNAETANQSPNDSDDNNSSNANGAGDGENSENDNASNDNDGEDQPEEDPCDNLECDQVECGDAEPTTSISGTVTIPSGELPLPNVSVYVPNAPVQPLDEGASCQQCAGMISGNPLVETATDHTGHFQLRDVPVGEDIPLVIQTGKWRRQVEIAEISPCQPHDVDSELTRLPQNSSQGNIPDIAVTTGGWDALQCLIRKIGVDVDEFTTEPDDGSITLYAGDDGTDRFADNVNGGQHFTEARAWWDDVNELADHDIVMHSCDYGSSTPSVEARDALRDFADIGGRAFLTDQHRVWLEEGPDEFQDVADWQGFSGSTEVQADIDTTFNSGQTMFDWMDETDGLDDNDQLVLWDIWNNVGSINDNFARRWIYSDRFGQEQDLYFSFTTPVGADEEDECGRVVYSDLHMADGSGADVYDPFPDGCTDDEMSGQEKALVYLLFDLTSCVQADCQEVTCQDIADDCGIHSDGCGGTIDCGECCSDVGEECKSDDECCDGLICDAANTCQVIP